MKCQKKKLIFYFFKIRTSTTVTIDEINEKSKPFQDKNLTVTPVIIYPSKVGKRNFQEMSGSSSNSSSSSESESDSEFHFKKISVVEEIDAHSYKQHVVNMMFTNTNLGQKAPGHTIEADCSPRPTKEQPKTNPDGTTTTSHPLSEESTQSTSPGRKVNEKQKNYLMSALPRSSADTAAITYICQGASVPPKFNKAAALKLGLKPGPVYGQLQKGISVTLDDGRVITRDMVCDPEVPGHVFVVVDCPNSKYIDELVNSKQFDPYLDPNGKSKINVMIHHLGNNVIHNPRYIDWLSKFDKTTDVSLPVRTALQHINFFNHLAYFWIYKYMSTNCPIHITCTWSSEII